MWKKMETNYYYDRAKKLEVLIKEGQDFLNGLRDKRRDYKEIKLVSTTGAWYDRKVDYLSIPNFFKVSLEEFTLQKLNEMKGEFKTITDKLNK
jgi:hypothetical protein